MERGDIFVIYGTEIFENTLKLLEAAELAEMIGDRKRSVAVKPNLVTAKPAQSGATTHPEIVAGVLEYLRREGFENVAVMEGSWVGDRTDEAYRVSGIGAVCEKYGVPYYDLQRDSAREYDARGMRLRICDRPMAADFIINLPVLKGHCQTHVTCALKNMKGFLPDSEKRRFHALGLMKPIAHLNAVIRQDFILVDNICGDLDFEEGGNPVEMDRLLAFADPVLCDAFACEAMGYALSEVPYIGMAEQLGVGSCDLARATVVELNHGSAAVESAPSRRVAALEEQIEARDACSACYGALIHALDRLGSSEREDRICIGQGWRDAEPTALAVRMGVGSCTKRCGYYCPGCPPTAASILKFLREMES